MQDVVKIIHDIPKDEKVLCFVYKERNNSNPKAALEIALRDASLIPEDKKQSSDRIFIEIWGNETSLNSYAHCRHVILKGRSGHGYRNEDCRPPVREELEALQRNRGM